MLINIDDSQKCFSDVVIDQLLLRDVLNIMMKVFQAYYLSYLTSCFRASSESYLTTVMTVYSSSELGFDSLWDHIT